MMNIFDMPSILIVDDLDADLDILNHILKKYYTIHVAKTGEEALRLAEKEKPDLILLDIILPDITGFVVLEKLKASSTMKEIPVIIITGIDNVQYEQKGLHLGAVDYVTKPFHNTVVLARIKTHVQIQRYIRAIEQLGLIDPVTGVSNLRGFENQLETEWARAVREKKTLSLLLIDVGELESEGGIADTVREEKRSLTISKHISSSLRRPADFLAKLDGRTFAVLLPNTEKVGAEKVADDIRSQANAPEDTTDFRIEKIGVAAASPTSEHSLGDFVAEAKTGLTTHETPR